MDRWRDELPNDLSGSAAKQRGAKQAVGSPATLSRKPAPTSNTDADHEPTTEERIKRSAPPWLVSTVFHLILLLVLALISTPTGGRLGRLIFEIGSSEGTDDTAFDDFAIDVSEMPFDDSKDLTDSESEVDVMSAFEALNDASAEQMVPVEIGSAAMAEIAKPMFNGRSGAMKKALLTIFGGTQQTQDAVELGLDWLRRNQLPDGSWSMQGPYEDASTLENKTAATAMALLAFLGDGNTHREGPYAAQVDRGVKYLIKRQSRNGLMAEKVGGHNQQTYAQAQATIVLCELYGMSQDSRLRDNAQLAVEYAQESQSPQGGWRYFPKTDSDTSVTGWYVMALQSAISAGLSVDRNVFYSVERYLDSAQSFEGAAYGYLPRSRPSAPMTAEGLLCRQYIGWPQSHPKLIEGIDRLWETDPFEIRDKDVYYWYYATQVLHHFGGEPWQRWNRRMRVDLPNAQVKSGHERGSWRPQGDANRASGRLFTTCLSIYCLEVYYRHMPLYKH
ncbi:prenyltransferase/squalene oxidase repeat-containing protein [Novipirellula aureliae]|nr:prenyltransferase/squalene oxidase repeat-containing protein [Novipirellula aureliae]